MCSLSIALDSAWYRAMGKDIPMIHHTLFLSILEGSSDNIYFIQDQTLDLYNEVIIELGFYYYL